MRNAINVRFYPQVGGSLSQSSGYIYNSGFTKTGKLWWDEGFGGDGAIYSTIDGSGDAYPIGECDNASRVIKYAVLLGYRYSHYNLVDMRIHDINVVADLTALDPNAPTKHDGTDDGAGPGPEDEVNPVSQQFADQNLIFQWLQSWWPTLQITVNAAFGACSLVMDLTVDILGTVNVILSDFDIQGINFDDPVTSQRVTEQAEQVTISTAKTGLALKVATAMVIVTSWLVINWGTYAIFRTTLIFWNVFMLAHLWAMYHEYANGRKTVDDAVTGILSVMVGWITTLIGFAAKQSKLTNKVQAILEKVFGPANAVAMKAAKWTLIITGILWILVMIAEIGMILSTQPMGTVFQVPSWVS